MYFSPPVHYMYCSVTFANYVSLWPRRSDHRTSIICMWSVPIIYKPRSKCHSVITAEEKPANYKDIRFKLISAICFQFCEFYFWNELIFFYFGFPPDTMNKLYWFSVLVTYLIAQSVTGRQQTKETLKFPICLWITNFSRQHWSNLRRSQTKNSKTTCLHAYQCGDPVTELNQQGIQTISITFFVKLREKEKTTAGC